MKKPPQKSDELLFEIFDLHAKLKVLEALQLESAWINATVDAMRDILAKRIAVYHIMRDAENAQKGAA